MVFRLDDLLEDPQRQLLPLSFLCSLSSVVFRVPTGSASVSTEERAENGNDLMNGPGVHRATNKNESLSIYTSSVRTPCGAPT